MPSPNLTNCVQPSMLQYETSRARIQTHHLLVNQVDANHLKLAVIQTELIQYTCFLDIKPISDSLMTQRKPLKWLPIYRLYKSSYSFICIKKQCTNFVWILQLCKGIFYTLRCLEQKRFLFNNVSRLEPSFSLFLTRNAGHETKSA